MFLYPPNINIYNLIPEEEFIDDEKPLLTLSQLNSIAKISEEDAADLYHKQKSIERDLIFND